MLEDALSVQTDNAFMGVFIRLNELGEAFVVRLVMRLKYKDGHETHYAFGRIMRLLPVLILGSTHNPDELQNICPSSSRRIMCP